MYIILFLACLVTGFAQEPSPSTVDEELVTWNPRLPKKKKQTEPLPPPPKPLPPKAQKKKSLQKYYAKLGGNYTFTHLTADGSFNGNCAGLQASFEYQPTNRFYGGAFFQWTQGNTSGSKGNRFLTKIDLQERLGYTWYRCKKKRFFTLFTGFGYRHFGHQIQSSGSSLSAQINTIYLPSGFLFRGKVNSITELGVNLQWMPQIYPTLKLDPLTGARWTLVERFANFRGEIPINIRTCNNPRLTVEIIPSFEYWQDGHTYARTRTGIKLNVSGNTYLLTGLDVNLGYAF